MKVLLEGGSQSLVWTSLWHRKQSPRFSWLIEVAGCWSGSFSYAVRNGFQFIEAYLEKCGHCGGIISTTGHLPQWLYFLSTRWCLNHHPSWRRVHHQRKCPGRGIRKRHLPYTQQHWYRCWHRHCWQWRWHCIHHVHASPARSIHPQHQVWWSASARGHLHTDGELTDFWSGLQCKQVTKLDPWIVPCKWWGKRLTVVHIAYMQFWRVNL